MSHRTILLTGFEPFAGLAVNPSAEVAKALDGRAVGDAMVRSAVLPVHHAEVAPRVAQLVDETDPFAVLHLGLAGGRARLSLERVAVNVMDYETPDNAGHVARGEPCVPDGPPAYFSTLPLSAILAALLAEGIPASVSNTAGTYLCNQTMYGTLHALGARRAPGPGRVRAPAAAAGHGRGQRARAAQHGCRVDGARGGDRARGHRARAVSDLRRNVLALGLDYGLFMVGLAFASQTTILPAFAAWLGAPNVVIGAIPAVMTLGWFLPQLFMAAHTATLPRKLPFVIRWTLFERLPFPALALVAFLLAERAPALALTLTLLMLLMTTVIGGVLMPAWLDIIARAVPARLRGRLFGLSALGAGLVGFGASALTAHALATLPPSAGYGLCFVGSSVCMVLSYIALLYVREPPGGPVAPPVALRAHLARVPGLLRRDRNLSWFLAARACAIVGQMATGFYTVYALTAWQAPASQPAVFTGLLVAGTVAGTLAFAWLADHAGHRLVILAGMAATLAANVMALASPTLSTYGLVLVLAGVQQAAFSVSNMAVLLEFSPSVDEHPIYVGLGMTSLAPFAFAAPLAAGLLADALGFRAVFGVASVGSVVGLTMLATLVRDPRTVTRPAVESRA